MYPSIFSQPQALLHQDGLFPKHAEFDRWDAASGDWLLLRTALLGRLREIAAVRWGLVLNEISSNAGAWKLTLGCDKNAHLRQHAKTYRPWF